MSNNTVHFMSRFRGIFFSLALLVLLTSCLGDDDNYVNEPVEVAYVSIYHASPDAPDFDIVVDGRVINNYPFDYTSYSGYLDFFTGDRTFKFNAANANNALIDTTFNFQDGVAYSLFAIDRLDNIEALLVVDSATAPSQGKAMLRFVHLSPDAPAFDVTVDGQTEALFTGRSFKQTTDFQEIEANTYSFDFKASGASDASVTAEGIYLLPGRYYTIIVRGFANPPAGNSNVLSVEVIGG